MTQNFPSNSKQIEYTIRHFNKSYLSTKMNHWSSVLLFALLAVSLTAEKISVEKSMVYGPGLSSNIVMPARYFYIQAVDVKGKK